MKKSLLLASTAVLALAACSKDVTTAVNEGRSIDFRASLATRATVEATTANLNTFYVTALDHNGDNFFDNAEFTLSNGFFTSNPKYYWPGDGSSLTFIAYAPSQLNASTTINVNKDNKIVDYYPSTNISEQVDFITANATGSSVNEATGVALSFRHRLCQIVIKGKNTDEGYIYKVKGIRIGSVKSGAKFDFSTTTWAWDNGKFDNYASEYDTPITLGANAASLMKVEDGNAMILPLSNVAWTPKTDATNTAHGSYLAVKVQITTKDGARVYPAVSCGDYDWAAVPVATDWAAGNKYIYTLDFSEGAGYVAPDKPTPDPDDPFDPGETILGKPIKFTATVQPWVDIDKPITVD